MEIGLSVKSEWEVIRNSLKEETQNTVAEYCLFLRCWLELMNDMHLKVHELSIDRVLRRCMEVILKTMQIAAVNSLLEQVDSGSSHKVVHW